MGVSAGFAALGVLSFAIASAGLAAHDLRTGSLPNRIVVPALAVTTSLFAAAIVAHGLATGGWVGDEQSATTPATTASWPPPLPAIPWLAETLGGALACFVGAFALWLAAPGGFGGGDVKAAPLAGLALGFTIGWSGVIWGALLAVVIAALWGLAVRVLTLRGRRGDEPGGPNSIAVPFAPALFGGAWIALVIDAARAITG